MIMAWPSPLTASIHQEMDLLPEGLHSAFYSAIRTPPSQLFPVPMRVCYALLAAAATILASHEVAAVSSHADILEMTASEEIQSINAAPMAATGHRRLRSHEAADEERAPLPSNLISLKDLMKVEDLVDPKKLKAALGKSAEASKTRVAMFDEMLDNADIRREVLARLDKLDDFKPLKSAWTRYILRKGAEYERQQEKAVAAAAAARRGGN